MRFLVLLLVIGVGLISTGNRAKAKTIRGARFTVARLAGVRIAGS